MIKKALVFILLVFAVALAAQDQPFAVRSSTRYGISSMFGIVELDSLTFYQMRLIQEFKYKGFSLGLDLDFLFDDEYHLLEEEWDQLKDIPSKIYYFRYGKQGEPVFFHYGGFTAYTIGNGLLMNNYTNMSYYPRLRNNGLLIGGTLPVRTQPTIELMTSDLIKNELIALNAHFSPLPDSSVNYIDDLIVGFSVIRDNNQKGNLHHTLADSLYSSMHIGKRDGLTAYSIDLEVPVTVDSNTVLGGYLEMAHIIGNGTGFILPGIFADFKFLKVNLEYRLHNRRFVPAYFDHFYEENRSVLVYDEEGAPDILTGEEALQEKPGSYGWYGKVQWIIRNRLKMVLAWQNMYGKEVDRGKSLWFTMRIDTRYKHWENMTFSYSKVNAAELSPGKVIVPAARLGFSFTISLGEKRRWFVVSKYSEKYKNKEGGINWWRDTERSFSAGVKYVY